MSFKSLFLLMLLTFGGGLLWRVHENREEAARLAAAPPSSKGQILVYGRDSCGYTTRTLEALRAAGVPMACRDIDDPAIQAEFQARFAAMDPADDRGFALPVVEFNGRASERPDPDGLLSDFRISQRIAAQMGQAN